MASFQELFDQVVGPLNDPAQFGRQEQVNLVPNQVPTDDQLYQQAAFVDYGGDKSLLRSEVERDLVTLKPHQFIGKYGEVIGSDMLRRKYAQSRRYDYDAAATRGLAQAAGDSLVSVISGFGSTVASPVAALAGFASPELGATMAGAIDEATAYANSLKSDAVQRRVKMQAARTAVREQQNQAQYEKDVANGESELVASLARFGRDAMGGAADVLTDPMQFSELAAQGVGSMAAIPLIGAGIGAGIPAGAATRLIAGAIGPTRTAVKAGRAIEKALPTTTAIGLTEAGGTFVQATNEVMNIPQAEIEKLPAYQERIAARMTPEEARLDMANDAGTQAALMQFPAAIAAGLLVSKFEAAPFARRSVTETFANLGKETLEEGTQSFTSQLAVNQAIKSNVDANRERLAGAGTQFGVGAVAGFGTAGAIQTPGVIAQGVADTFSAAKTAVDQRLEGIRRANEQASPVSDDKVAEQATQVETAAPAVQAAVDLDENLTPERKAELNQLVQDVTESAIQLDGDSLAQDESQPPAVREAAAGQSTMVGYLQSLSRIAADEKRPELDRVHAHMALSQTVQAISGFLDQLPDSVQDLAEDHPVREFIGSIQGMNAALMSSPSVSKATEQAPAVMQKAVDANPLTETSDANVAGIHLAAADLAPETATRESVDTLLKMATKGKLQLNEQQYTNLTMLKKLFDNAAAYDEEIKLAGAKPQDIVSRAIKTDTSGVDGELSALQHAQGIRQALVQGDVEGAKARLEDLGMFAQHMQNKVNAINSHMATKDPTMATAPTYQKLVGTLGNRAFVDSGKPIGVTPTSANSIRQVQLIGAEANFVTNAFNILAETFPQLDIQPMELVELDAQLDGRPEELAAQFTAAKEKAKKQPKAETKPAPAKPEPAPVAEQQVAPAPVRGQEVTPEFEQTKLAAIRAMSDADLKRHLKTLTNDLMNEDSSRKARVVEMITAEQQARADLAKVNEEDDTPPWDNSEEPAIKEEKEPAPAPTKKPAAPLAEEDKKRGFALNAGQKSALIAIKNFLADKTKRTFSLIGAAGTGKTTIVEEILGDLDRNQFSEVILSSPTHRANAVTRSKNPRANVMTLHKLLGLKPSVDLENFDAKNVKFSEDGDSEIPSNSLIIMDESSMISDQLFNFLMSKIDESTGSKIIFLGDSAQLNPVKQNTASKALTSTEGVAELTTVERAKNAALLDESVAVRQTGKFTNTQNMSNGNGVTFTNSHKDFVNLAIKLFQSERFKQNRLLGRVLAFTNAKVDQYNALIRKALFPGEQNIVSGDLLMGYNAFGAVDKESNMPSIANGVDYMVTNTSPVVMEVVFGVEIPVQQITIQDTLNLRKPAKVKVIANTITQDQRVKLEKALGDIHSRAWRTGSPEMTMLKQFNEEYALPFDAKYHNDRWNRLTTSVKKTFDFGYAHTIHKSQGGTYDYALVDDVDITTKSRDKGDQARLRYVGLTRAKFGTYVLTDAQITSKTNTVAESIEESFPAEPATQSEIAQESSAKQPDAAPVSKQDKWVQEGKAELKNGVYYINEPNLVKNIAGTNGRDVYVDMTRATDPNQVRDYLIKGSEQKAKMLEVMGITAEQFLSLFTDSNGEIDTAAFIDFLIAHEKSHVANNDYQKYPRIHGKWDLMNEEAIDIEVRATEDAFTPEQRANYEEMVESNAAIDTFTKSKEKNPLLNVYSNLIGGARNRFVNTFNLPMNPISKLDGSSSPIQDVLRGLKDTVDDIGAMRAFQAILGDFPSVLAYLNGKMNLRLGKKSRTIGGKTLVQAAIDGSMDVTIYPNGRAVAIAEIDGNKLAWNTELAAKAYLAAVNWLLNGMSFIQLYDKERAAKVLNISEEEVTDQQMELLNRGVTRLQAIDALANNIQRYWGVTPKADVVDGFTKGIPQAVAANLIDMMLNQDFNGEKTLTETKLDLGINKDLVIYTPVSLNDSGLNNYRDAIEKLISATPELVVYMGDDKPPVAKTQMNNPSVPNTPDQIKMIENMNATGYTVNLQTLGVYEALGIDNIIALLGEPNVDKTTTNKNTLLSRKGRNTNIANAWKTVQQTLFQMELQAEEDGVSVDQVQIHYAHNMTSVGRAQQLGRYTPQSSKLMRSIFLPTNSKPLNLTDTTGQDWKAFMLSLGQLLGVKVHNFDPDVTEGILFGDDKKPGLLNGKYARVIEVLQDQIQTGRAFSVTELNLFKEVMGKPTPETIQALTDYARFLNTEDKSQYVTQLYLEADGMSNGPFNAMALFTMGNFTPEQLKNLGKCGLYFGGEPELQTTWVQRQKDTVDLYGEVSVGTLDNIKTLTDGAIAQAAEPKGRASAERYLAMRKHMNRLMGLLLPDMVELNADGDIVSINRSLPKNPSAITTYGSGKQGIADNLTNAMLDNLYARISDALLARSQDPTLTAAQAMFRDDPKADEKLALLDEAMKALTSYTAVVSKKTGYTAFSVKDSIPEQISISTEYTVSSNAFKVLSDNVRNLVVSPMDSAIQSTIGHTVGVAVNSLRTLTQIQGIILANAYQKRVNELVAKNSAKTLVRGGYLSAKQQREILESLNPLHPQINTGAQNYFIAGGERANLNDKTPYGESFNGKINALPTVYAPVNPGVKGIATMVIGSGDGMTIQFVAVDPTNTERTLFVFDGINYALDFIKQGSVAANKAAFNAILGNPMQEVSKNFDAFLAELDGKLDVYTDMSTDMKFQIGQALFGFGFTMEEADALTGDVLMRHLENQAAAARKYSLSIQARHNVLSRVNLGMDQMAAAGSPYLVTDKIELVGEPHEIANQLTQLYKEELAKLMAAAAVADNDANIAKRRPNVPLGISHESGVSILDSGSIKALVDSMKGKVSRPQSLALTQAIKNVVAEGYKVISGSYDQLMAYNQNLGANGIDASRIDPDSDQGMTLPDRKEIWLLNADSEVMAHEMIHASTFMTILAYMQNKFGQEKHEIPANVAESIEALQNLMYQFLDAKNDLLKGNVDFALMQDYESASNAIMSALSDPHKDEATRQATALNEYMAWGLANQNLAQAQSKVPVKFTTIVWDTLKAIRNWLIGSNSRNTDDMLSNLAYHTKVVMSATQPSLSTMTNDTSLMMARVYGHDQRLADLDRTFNQKVADYVTAQGPVQQVRRTNEVALSGINAFHMVGLFSGNGFPMTPQETNTFYKVVAALGTQAKLDPAVMNRMQELYAAATRELTVESFMKDPQGNNPADYAQAEKKYEVVMGQRGVGKDPIGRSTLMPAFMALALTNDTFREVLAKLPVPRTEASTQERAFDRLLENQANKMLDQLSDVLSGQKRSANVQQAIDNLAYQLVDAAQQSQGFYDQYVTPLGTLADKANATIVESMSKVADKFTTLAEQRRQAGKDRKLIDSVINNTLEVTASIINEEKAGLLGEAILAGANASQALPKWMHDLIADLVGRVDSNADLYDMIKKVRSSIQRLRNQFRTELPKTLAKQFTRKVTKEEWSTMNAALGKSNLAAVVQNGSFTRTDTLAMLGNQPALNRGIRKLEDEIKALDSKFAKQYLDRAQQLATFMMTGVTGQSLARNARAIVRRLGTNQSALNFDPALERAVDSLASLYAVNMLSDADKQVMGSLVQSQKAGVEFTFGYALGLHNQELSRLGDSVNGQAFVNHYKGHMPSLQQDGVSLRIDDDKEFVKLVERSYIRKAPYAKSSLDQSAPQSYYFAPVNGRSNFNQGIVQNVRQTMGGVDSITGYTVGGLTGGRITDPRQVARIAAALSSGRYTEKGSNLLPVYDNATGNVVAYERSADPTMLQALNYNTNFGEVMGAWKGRLAEETLAVQFNQVSVEYMAEMYRKDTLNNSANKAQYVDLFDTRVHKKYPVIADAVKLFTPSTVDAIHAQFPDGRFWVRKEMLDNVTGYRSATVGDAWTGNTYWSKETQEAIRKTAMLVFGNKAYANFVNAEQTLQGVVQDAKTLIIVKSIVVPVANILSGMLQLVARGVPFRSILVGLPKKLAETRQYVASEKRAIEAEAELHATTDAAKQRRLKVEIQSIRDSYKRMSIWPLIERGELSSMSDDAQPEDQELVAGKLNAFIEAQVNKLPPAIRAAGKYALITKDTALYKGLRKSVEYGDFLVKAILWDDLVNRQGKDVDYANGRITEEFVNYDRLGGRNRQYLESMGLLWFYNFKIRSAKVGLSIIRNNPLHALMAATIPAPSSIGTPITDNLFSLAVEGRLGYSIGLDQLIGAPMMHPLDNVIF